MMKLSSHIDGLMQGVGFRSEETASGEVDTISFEVRRAKDCVELHIINRVFHREGNKRATAKYMLHTYTPAAFLSLLQVLETVKDSCTAKPLETA
jgi:hypothetical protein